MNIMFRLILLPTYLSRRYLRTGNTINRKYVTLKNCAIFQKIKNGQAKSHFSNQNNERKVNAYVTIFTSRSSLHGLSFMNGRLLAKFPIRGVKENRKDFHHSPLYWLETCEENYITSQLLESKRKSSMLGKVTLVPTLSTIKSKIRERRTPENKYFNNSHRKEYHNIQQNDGRGAQRKGESSEYHLEEQKFDSEANNLWPASLFSRYLSSGNGLQGTRYLAEIDKEPTVVQRMIDNASTSMAVIGQDIESDNNHDSSTLMLAYDKTLKTKHPRKVTFEVSEKGDIKVVHWKNKIDSKKKECTYMNSESNLKSQLFTSNVVNAEVQNMFQNPNKKMPIESQAPNSEIYKSYLKHNQNNVQRTQKEIRINNFSKQSPFIHKGLIEQLLPHKNVTTSDTSTRQSNGSVQMTEVHQKTSDEIDYTLFPLQNHPNSSKGQLHDLESKSSNDGITKIPITRENFPVKIDPVVEPHRNLLDITTSIDRSTIILQKDFYIAEKIKKKIKEIKKPKHSPSGNKIKDMSLNNEGIESSNEPNSGCCNQQKLQGPLFYDTIVDVEKTKCKVGHATRSTNYLSDITKLYLNTQNDADFEFSHSSRASNVFNTEIFENNGCYNHFSGEITLRQKKSESEVNLVTHKNKTSLLEEHPDSTSKEHVPLIKRQSKNSDKCQDSTLSSPINYSKLGINFMQHRFSHSPNNPSHPRDIDIITKTIITSIKTSNKASIEVQEEQTFLDKRLPIPFHIESIFQVVGSPDTLKEYTHALELTKTQLEAVKYIEPKLNESPTAKETGTKKNSINKFTSKSKNLNIKRPLNAINKEYKYSENINRSQHSQNKERLIDVNKIFYEVKLVNKKDIDKFIKDGHIKPESTHSSQKSDGEHTIHNAKNNNVRNQLGTEPLIKMQLIKPHPVKKIRRKTLSQRMKSRGSTNGVPQIIDIKPLIRALPKGKSTRANTVDFTQGKYMEKDEKNNKIVYKEATPENRKYLTKRDETFIKHLLKKNINNSIDFKHIEENKVKENNEFLPPNIKYGFKKPIKPTARRKKYRGGRSVSYQNSTSHEDKKKTNSIMSQKAEQLKQMFKDSSKESPSYMPVSHKTRNIISDRKEHEFFQASKTCEEKHIVRNLEKAHIKEGVPLEINEGSMPGLKKDEVQRLSLGKSINQKYELDTDKFSREISYTNNLKSYKHCLVPVEEITTFPLINREKPLSYTLQNSIIYDDAATTPNLKEALSSLPSVSKVLNATMPDGSKAALNRWRLNMISKLGEEGFKEFYLDQLTKGKEFHKTLEKQLSGQAIPPGSISMSTNECLKSIDWVLRQLSEISVVESRVVHSKLGYRGVLDCVAKFRNKPVLIEWKRSDKPKPLLQSTYDAPIQLSAYVGAFNFDTNYNFQIEGGLVVVAYSNGANADIFHITLEQCNQYWKLWLARLKQYISKTAI